MPAPSKQTSFSLLLRSFLRRTPKPVAIPSCYPLLQITADPAKCDHCGKCARACPMNIDILAHVDSIQRVNSTDCILCQSCINVCTENALTITSCLEHPRKS